MPFTIIRNDITKVTADAIVNTANPRPVIGGGTDSAIYHAAGEDLLLAERRKIGDIARGDAVQTPAFGLNAKYIIHTVGPVWTDGKHGERETLHSCYKNSLALAAELSCESIAFPLISTGSYSFPKNEALDIALDEISKFLLMYEKDMDIILVVFDNASLQYSKALIGDIDEFIDEHTVRLLHRKEYSASKSNALHRRMVEEKRRDYRREQELWDAAPCAEGGSSFVEQYELCDAMPLPKMAPPVMSQSDMFDSDDMDLDGYLTRKGDTFQQRLFKLIDERHMEDPEVYKKANIDRKVFSKIRCDKNYHPKKKTAVAFGIALELDLPEMRDLLSRAGYALSPSSEFDLIISYFIKKKNYDINRINVALFDYHQELLGY